MTKAINCGTFSVCFSRYSRTPPLSDLIRVMTPAVTAKDKLAGIALPGGWNVIRRIPRGASSTGGYFSTGYVVENVDGRKGFLKALDYSEAFNSKNPPVSVALQELTATINFEKYVLARCRDRRLDKIVVSIDDGTIGAALDTVEYLIFELADGDVRKQMSVINRLDFAWRLRSLHHIATGLEQLHRNQIIHQDLKPSNVLVFQHAVSKLADFGRSACHGQVPPHAGLVFAGDYTYAPPDVLYGFPLSDNVLRSLSFDAYLLGSMTVFLFTGEGATAMILHELDPAYVDWQNFRGDKDDIRLQLSAAFAVFLRKLRASVGASDFDEVVEVVRQLCEPDPLLRGHPKEKRGKPNQFSLERYVTRFDVLARRAELGFFK